MMYTSRTMKSGSLAVSNALFGRGRLIEMALILKSSPSHGRAKDSEHYWHVRFEV